MQNQKCWLGSIYYMRLKKKSKRNGFLNCYKIQLLGADPEILKRQRRF